MKIYLFVFYYEACAFLQTVFFEMIRTFHIYSLLPHLKFPVENVHFQLFIYNIMNKSNYSQII